MIYGLIAFTCLLILFACIAMDIIGLVFGQAQWKR